MEEKYTLLMWLEDYNEGMHSLMNWILGAGERWLLTLHEIGESYDDAKQLLKEHNQLESKSIVRSVFLFLEMLNTESVFFAFSFF